LSLPRPIDASDLDHVVARSRGVWEQARGTRTFLTGGTGFFGVWLAESFAHANVQLDLGAELVILSRDPAAAVARMPSLANLMGVRFHRGDVRHFEFPEGEFDRVVNGAAESSQQGHVGDHRHMFDTIVDGTRRTLAFVRHAAVPSYTLLSSGAVYGVQPANLARVPESFSGAPPLGDARSAYGEAKRAAEVLAAVEADWGDLSVRVARCFAFVGPHLPLDIHFAIGNFIRDAMARAPIRIKGDGTATRSYLYMADLAAWVWTIALGPSASGAYNVGSELEVSILETAQVVAAAIAPGTEIIVEGKPVPGVPPHRYVPSTERAGGELGLQQYVSLNDSIVRTVTWLRNATR
jgi:dTDP-glucose 4,6-dehydratase